VSAKVSAKSAAARYALSDLAYFHVHGPRIILSESIALLISQGAFGSGGGRDWRVD